MPAKPRRRTPSRMARKSLAVGTGDLDQLIVAARAHGLGGPLMHRRRRRMRDRRTEQAGEEASARRRVMGVGEVMIGWPMLSVMSREIGTEG